PATVESLGIAPSPVVPTEQFGRGTDARAGVVTAPMPAFGGGAGGARFYRSDSNGNQLGDAKANSSVLLQRDAQAPLPVLSSFVIEQNGSVVRLVDADGSVYDGLVEAPVRTEFDSDIDRLSAGKTSLCDNPTSLKRE